MAPLDMDMDSLGAGGTAASVALAGDGAENSTGLEGIGEVCIRVVGNASAAPHSMTALMISMLAACGHRTMNDHVTVARWRSVEGIAHLLQDQEIVHRFHCEVAGDFHIQTAADTDTDTGATVRRTLAICQCRRFQTCSCRSSQS